MYNVEDVHELRLHQNRLTFEKSEHQEYLKHCDKYIAQSSINAFKQHRRKNL